MCFRISFGILLSVIVIAQAYWRIEQRPLNVFRISEKAKVALCRMTDSNRLKTLLRPLLVPRVVGTEQHKKVALYIQETMKRLGFTVEIDRFNERTPHGEKPFRNIIATYDINAPRRLVLACHYESKIFPGAEFIGATDSAVPCAMLLDIATTFAPLLRTHTNKEVTLQMLFLDGEEAFGQWTDTDSLYGARHLAKLWSEKWYSHSGGSSFSINNEIDRIDVLVLLDLLGASNPQIHNMYGLLANNLFEELTSIESKLKNLGCLHQLPQMFFSGLSFSAVEDDHVPFLGRGVPVLHLIPTPFPRVWHTLKDTEAALDYPTIDNLVIITLHVAE
uniref:Glutaminyl-peptide cyclotransferase n=1 Tax=Parascaris univalens TaxID=6257 RepID=A0A915C7C8_PARUN